MRMQAARSQTWSFQRKLGASQQPHGWSSILTLPFLRVEAEKQDQIGFQLALE